MPIADNEIDATHVKDGVLTPSKMKSIPAGTVMGRCSNGDGVPQMLTIPDGSINIDAAGNISVPRVVKSFANNVSHTFVSTAASANGFQVSALREAIVCYAITASAAVQIGVATNVSGHVLLEIAATNSVTASDWQEVGRVGTGQLIGLAIALSSTQTVSGQLGCVLPAGYWARLRTVNVSGVPVYTYNSGQEVII